MSSYHPYISTSSPAQLLSYARAAGASYTSRYRNGQLAPALQRALDSFDEDYREQRLRELDEELDAFDRDYQNQVLRELDEELKRKEAAVASLKKEKRERQERARERARESERLTDLAQTALAVEIELGESSRGGEEIHDASTWAGTREHDDQQQHDGDSDSPSSSDSDGGYASSTSSDDMIEGYEEGDCRFTYEQWLIEKAARVVPPGHIRDQISGHVRRRTMMDDFPSYQDRDLEERWYWTCERLQKRSEQDRIENIWGYKDGDLKMEWEELKDSREGRAGWWLRRGDQ